MKNHLIDIMSSAGLGIAVVALSATAAADGQDQRSEPRPIQSQSVEVAFSDLNLSAEAGVEVLYSRLENAAEKVCAPRPHSRHMLMWRDWKRCVATALDDSVAGSAIPVLLDIHLVETGRRVVEIAPSVASRN